jgi:hypothetical protein
MLFEFVAYIGESGRASGGGGDKGQSMRGNTLSHVYTYMFMCLSTLIWV